MVAAVIAPSEPSYWEINDRGTTFAFLSPERRAKLDAFFAMLRALQ